MFKTLRAHLVPSLTERRARDIEQTKIELYDLKLHEEDNRSRQMTLKARLQRLETEMQQEMEAQTHEISS